MNLNHLLSDTLVGPLNLLQLLLIVFGVACLGLAIAGVIKRIEKQSESIFFSLLCLAFLAWAAGVFGAQLPDADARLFEMIDNISLALIPAMILFHVWMQVHHRALGAKELFLYMTGPALLSAYQVALWVNPQLLAGTAWEEAHWFPVVLFVVGAFLYCRAYLLCLNAFFQMPRHMRKPTLHLITGVTFVLAFSVLPFFNLDHSGLMMLALALMALLILYRGIFLIRALDVIATTREFVFETLPTLVLVLNTGSRVLDWNYKGTTRVMPFPAPDYMENFTHYKTRALAALQGHVTTYSNDIVTVYHNGEQRHFQFSFHEISNRKKIYGYTVVIAEITGIYSVYRQLADIALIDQLTGLGSRNGYLMQVQDMIGPEKLPLLIILGDVNGLKVLNDSKGHLAGDALLKAVANCIATSLPEKASAFRIGGDEYVVLVPGGTAQAAEAFIHGVNTLSAQINDPLYGSPSVSWGYSIMEAPTEDYNTVFEMADKMMYEQKKTHFTFRSSGIVPELYRKNEKTAENQNPANDVLEGAPCPEAGHER